MRKVHYYWPDLGETVRYKDITGFVESRNMGHMTLRVRDADRNCHDIKLEDFIVEEIRQNAMHNV